MNFILKVELHNYCIPQGSDQTMYFIASVLYQLVDLFGTDFHFLLLIPLPPSSAIISFGSVSLSKGNLGFSSDPYNISLKLFCRMVFYSSLSRFSTWNNNFPNPRRSLGNTKDCSQTEMVNELVFVSCNEVSFRRQISIFGMFIVNRQLKLFIWKSWPLKSYKSVFFEQETLLRYFISKIVIL